MSVSYTHLDVYKRQDLEKFHFKAYQRFREHKDKFLLKIIRDNIEWGIKEELYRNDINLDVCLLYTSRCV